MSKNEPVSHEPKLKHESKPALVPMGFTIGLAIFAVVLSLLGYGFRIIFGEPVDAVLAHMVKVVPIFVIGIPLLFLLGAMAMNKFNGMRIHWRNAISLGWLISCVTMLWLMGTYS